HLLSAPTKENYSLSGLPSTAADIFLACLLHAHILPPRMSGCSTPTLILRSPCRRSAEPCSPERTRTGYGPQLRSAASSQAKASTKSLVVRTFKNGRSAEIDPPRAATGKGSIPGARRNRIGGAATTCQPSGPISIARHVSSQRSR